MSKTVRVEDVEYAILYSYWLHGITRSLAIQLLQVSAEEFEDKLNEFVDGLEDDVLEVEKQLRPSAL